jgi:hypothetical protein
MHQPDFGDGFMAGKALAFGRRAGNALAPGIVTNIMLSVKMLS